MSHICVMVVMGLPGSGKTSLCKHFLAHVNEYEEGIEVEHICFDKLALEYNLENYKEFRNEVFKFVEHNLDEYLSMNKKTILILDDIMYYRSMRKQYYNLCKKYGLCYCQVYINCDYDVAISRVANRDEDDDEHYEKTYPETILQIAQKLEVPSAEPWERFTIELQNEVNLDNATMDLVWNTINSSMLCPVESTGDTDDEDETIEENEIHLIDIILRKYISEKIKNIKMKDEDVNVSLIGKELSIKKKSFLDKIKITKFSLSQQHSQEIVKMFETFLSTS